MICSWDPQPENCLFYTGTAMVMVMSNECVREHAQVRGVCGHTQNFKNVWRKSYHTLDIKSYEKTLGKAKHA